MSYGLSRTERLSKTSQFLDVRQFGISVKCPSFWLQMSMGPAEKLPRLGIIATKRIGNAVHRNRAKRLIRELYRKNKTSIPKSAQTVVVPRKAIFQMVYTELESSFKDAIVKASNRL
ncbi:MAG: ribonuclease P protein component [Opitutae bacterium]